MFHTAAVARVAIGFAVVVFSAHGRAENLLLNSGAEQGKGNEPSIWARASVPADGLRMERSTTVAHKGKASLAIFNKHEYGQPVANNWMQSLQKVPHGGTLRVRAAIRTLDADSANVCLQCWDITGEKMLAFATTPVLRGDQDWITVASRPVIVPADTAEIIIRAALAGIGQAWFDELEVAAEDQATAVEADVQVNPTVGANAKDRASLDHKLREQLPGPLARAVPVAKDCMVLKYLPDWQHGNVDNIAVANNDGGVRTLIAWKPLPRATVANPKLKFYLALYSRKTTFVDGGGAVTICPITDDWPELTSWKSQPKVDEQSEPPATKLEDNVGWKLFDVTKLIREKSSNRRGVMLKFSKEDKSGAKSDWSGYEFVSREGLGEWEHRRPMLLVIEQANGDSADIP